MGLVYDVFAQTLSGSVGDQRFQLRAFSGGGRGKSYGLDRGETDLTSWLSTTRTDDGRGVRGGPIPPGVYECVYISNHQKFHECVFLKPALSARRIYTPFANHPIEHRRSRFYIHGRGHHGSDGCIVPEDPSERKRLNAAI